MAILSSCLCFLGLGSAVTHAYPIPYVTPPGCRRWGGGGASPGWLAMPETQRYIGQTHDATIMGQSTQRCVGGQRHNAIGQKCFSQAQARHRPATDSHRAAPQSSHSPVTAPRHSPVTVQSPPRHFTFFLFRRSPGPSYRRQLISLSKMKMD